MMAFQHGTAGRMACNPSWPGGRLTSLCVPPRSHRASPCAPQALSYLREVKTRFATNRKVYDR